MIDQIYRKIRKDIGAIRTRIFYFCQPVPPVLRHAADGGLILCVPRRFDREPQNRFAAIRTLSCKSDSFALPIRRQLLPDGLDQRLAGLCQNPVRYNQIRRKAKRQQRKTDSNEPLFLMLLLFCSCVLILLFQYTIFPPASPPVEVLKYFCKNA